RVGNYINCNDFITVGSPLTQEGAFYKGRVLSLFGQTASNTKQKLENLSVYPNTVEDQLIIEDEVAYKDSDQVKVYTRLEQDISIAKRIEANRMYLDVSHLSKGMYHIEVTVDNREGYYKILK